MSDPAGSLRGKAALVLGLGVHGGGAGVVRFLVEHGAVVTVTDLRPPEKLETTLASLSILPVLYVLGEHREADVRSADVIVRNPAVPRESPWLDLARRHGVPVLMEMNLFWAHCPAPIVAITGSKGKSTTTAWLGHTWRLSRPDTVVAGNLRVSALEALPLIGPDTPVVLELSSWQLESFGDTRIGPHVSCVTNIAPDHLNRYSDMADYASSKREIYRYQRPEDIAVLCWDDPVVRGFAADCPAQVRWFGLEEAPSEGAHVSAGWIVLRGAEASPLLPVGELGLRGPHNVLNALATAALADACGLPAEQIAEGLRTFKGLPDRMEPVAYINGVAYINDTTSTTPVSTIAALRTIEGPIALIAGGASKNVGFADLAPEICARVSYLALLEGSATDELQAAVNGCSGKLDTEVYGELQSAVSAAAERAGPGWTVLLSPACASFGMFDNEFQRGEQFRAAVRELGSKGQGALHGR